MMRAAVMIITKSLLALGKLTSSRGNCGDKQNAGPGNAAPWLSVLSFRPELKEACADF